MASLRSRYSVWDVHEHVDAGKVYRTVKLLAVDDGAFGPEIEYGPLLNQDQVNWFRERYGKAIIIQAKGAEDVDAVPRPEATHKIALDYAKDERTPGAEMGLRFAKSVVKHHGWLVKIIVTALLAIGGWIARTEMLAARVDTESRNNARICAKLGITDCEQP